MKSYIKQQFKHSQLQHQTLIKRVVMDYWKKVLYDPDVRRALHAGEKMYVPSFGITPDLLLLSPNLYNPSQHNATLSKTWKASMMLLRKDKDSDMPMTIDTNNIMGPIPGYSPRSNKICSTAISADKSKRGASNSDRNGDQSPAAAPSSPSSSRPRPPPSPSTKAMTTRAEIIRASQSIRAAATARITTSSTACATTVSNRTCRQPTMSWSYTDELGGEGLDEVLERLEQSTKEKSLKNGRRRGRQEGGKETQVNNTPRYLKWSTAARSHDDREIRQVRCADISSSIRLKMPTIQAAPVEDRALQRGPSTDSHHKQQCDDEMLSAGDPSLLDSLTEDLSNPSPDPSASSSMSTPTPLPTSSSHHPHRPSSTNRRHPSSTRPPPFSHVRKITNPPPSRDPETLLRLYGGRRHKHNRLFSAKRAGPSTRAKAAAAAAEDKPMADIVPVSNAFKVEDDEPPRLQEHIAPPSAPAVAADSHHI